MGGAAKFTFAYSHMLGNACEFGPPIEATTLAPSRPISAIGKLRAGAALQMGC